MQKKFMISLVIPVILGLIGFLAIFGYYLFRVYILPSSTILPGPLGSVDFPSDPAPYPSAWPDELKFPESLVLVDSSSGIMPDGAAPGWSAKLRYQGKPAQAERILSSFLEGKGWTIVENQRLDSGGFSLIIQRVQGNGIIVIDIDPDDSSQILVIVTVFP